MANKYLIHGATYNGNGTSSAEATVDGGVGAWNSLNVFDAIGTPNYGGGSLVAGDTVFIRSKDASGNNLTRTLTATVTLGSAAATTANWVTWVLDNGTVWPGIDGTLTYNCPSTFVVTLRNFNNYTAMTQDAFRIVETNAAASYKGYFGLGLTYSTTNLLVDFGANTSSDGCHIVQVQGATFTNLHIISNRRGTTLLRVDEYYRATYINPRIELLSTATTQPVFSTTGTCTLDIQGGSVSGPGAVAGQTVFSLSGAAQIRSVGFQFPKEMKALSQIRQTDPQASVNLIGTDGEMGGLFSDQWGLADSRDDNNYPKLNATLPDTANTPWSWKLCPANSSERFPLEMPMTQYFTDTAGTREITVNLLIATTLTNVNKQTVWMTIDYTDNATGLKKSLNTRDYLAGALDVSTANWTATTYGAASLLKRKLSVVTPTAIKPNTPITVVLWSTVKAASTTDELGDIMFLCPEFSVNVP